MGEIDELYTFILNNILPPPQDPVRKFYLERLRTVLGYLVVLREPLDIGSISTLPSLDGYDVLYCMKRISSFLVCGTESMTKRTIPKLHKSVVDYLISSRADPEFRIELHQTPE